MATGMQAPRGTKDIFGPEFDRFEALERLAANVARIWGYAGIRTPVFEHTGLFVRSIGEATDIVEKEMFTIPRQSEKEDQDSYTLRPENTAGVVRAYLEHNLHKTQGLAKFFYVGPQFRRERPQAGRLRQFHQMGAEVLGLKKGASLDQSAPFVAYADVMLLALDILDRAGLKKLVVRYNTVGCSKPGCRDAYRNSLKAKLIAQKERLCGDCQRRLERNVFRVLDCKKPNCREVCKEILQEISFTQVRFREELARRRDNLCSACWHQMQTPPPSAADARAIVQNHDACRAVVNDILSGFLPPFCEDCLHQAKFLSTLIDKLYPEFWPKELEGFNLDPTLVRGLDYYTGVVFEFTSMGLGAQDAVGGGGSYDGLIEEMGGPLLGATGFALGLERVRMAQDAAGVQEVPAPTVSPLVYVAHVSGQGENPPSYYGFGSKSKFDLAIQTYLLTVKLRRHNIRTEYELDKHGRKLGNSLSRAKKLGARLVLLIGEDELAAGEATIKDMAGGEQRRVKAAEVVAEVKKALG